MARPIVEVIRGKDAILAIRKPLEEFAELCGQPDSMHWLQYFLQSRRRKVRPYLVVVRHPDSEGRPLKTSDLEGTALFFEYGTRFLRTWAFVGDELVARDADRGRIAALTLEAILECGAHVVVSTYRRAPEDFQDPGPLLATRGIQWAQRCRQGKRSLKLGPTYEATLARLGKSTRFNFRYYRKRFQARHLPEFVPDARTALSEQDALVLNASSRNPVSDAEIRLRYENSARRPGGFLVGLRDRKGEWISAIGGWRCGDAVVVQWQSNSKLYPKDSMINVVRAMFLEDLVSQGVRELFFVGGTTHSMHHSFEEEVAFDLFVRKNSKRASLLQLLAQPFARPSFFLEQGNFLATGLCSEKMQWYPPHPSPAPSHIGDSARARQAA